MLELKMVIINNCLWFNEKRVHAVGPPYVTSESRLFVEHPVANTRELIKSVS